MNVNNITLLCLCFMFTSGVIGKTKRKASQIEVNGGSIVEPISHAEKNRIVRQYAPYSYEEYAAQNTYAASQYQSSSPVGNGYGDQQENYGGYGQPNRGIVGGRIKPGETVSIGNGQGNTNVVALNGGGGGSDYYVGYSIPSDGGYNQGYPNKHGQSGIVVNKKPNGQDDVLLYNDNKYGQSGIVVNQKPGRQDDVLLYNDNGRGQSGIAVTGNQADLFYTGNSRNRDSYPRPQTKGYRQPPAYGNGNYASSSSVYGHKGQAYHHITSY